MTYRELNPDEYHLLPDTLDFQKFNHSNGRVLAAFNADGDVVAAWGLAIQAHVEPFWIREDHRNHPSILRRMNDKMKDMMTKYGIREVFAVMENPALQRFAVKFFGAKAVPGTLYNWKDTEA